MQAVLSEKCLTTKWICPSGRCWISSKGPRAVAKNHPLCFNATEAQRIYIHPWLYVQKTFLKFVLADGLFLLRHLELIIICSTVKSRVILNKRRMKEGLKRSPERSPVTRSIISFYFCSVLLFFFPLLWEMGRLYFFTERTGKGNAITYYSCTVLKKWHGKVWQLTDQNLSLNAKTSWFFIFHNSVCWYFPILLFLKHCRTVWEGRF